MPLITSTPTYRAGATAIFVVWDEGNGGSAGEDCSASPSDESCHVLAIWVAPSVRSGTGVTSPLDDYSYFRTIEDLLGVPELGAARSAKTMVTLFNL